MKNNALRFAISCGGSLLMLVGVQAADGVDAIKQRGTLIVGVKAELTYTLNTLGNRTLVFVGENDSSTSVDTITVDASGALVIDVASPHRADEAVPGYAAVDGTAGTVHVFRSDHAFYKMHDLEA